MDRGSVRLLASKILPSQTLLQGPALVLPDFGEKVPFLIHLWETGPKEVREDPRGQETKTQTRTLVEQAVRQDRVERVYVQPEAMFLKITLLSAVVKQYNKYEK